MTQEISYSAARRRLYNRWLEQVELYPAMQHDIPLAFYISAHVKDVAWNGLLEGYDK